MIQCATLQLRDFDRRLKESESRCRVVEGKVGCYEPAEYTAKVADIYKSSLKFKEKFFVKSNTYYDRGCAHILCQFH